MKISRAIACGALILFVALSPALGQPAIPETPAGKVLAAWLAAFNSGDAALIRAFDETYKPEPQLGQMVGGGEWAASNKIETGSRFT